MIKAMLIVIGMLMVVFAVRRSNAAAIVDLKTLLASPVDLTIYSADRKLVIGHARYVIKESGKVVEVNGDSHYLDGERDWERVAMEYQPGNPLPVVTSFLVNYLAADGSVQLIEKADFKSGQASCRWSNQLHDTSYEDSLEFPPDTYAGATSVVPLEYALKKGEQSVHFHVFNCMPKPAVLAIDAKQENGMVRWSYYPGDLARMGLTPDLGWLNLVAKPFIPDISVWFDPSDGYQYVGATKDRFYRGRSQIMVRASSRGVTVDGRQDSVSKIATDPSK
jgi:hypothetical protein